jgi:hypothetical protein
LSLEAALWHSKMNMEAQVWAHKTPTLALKGTIVTHITFDKSAGTNHARAAE